MPIRPGPMCQQKAANARQVCKYLPSVCPGRWCRVMPWQKSNVRSSKTFQFKDNLCARQQKLSVRRKFLLQVMLEVNANIGTSSDGPERSLEFPVMYPDLDVLAV